jgi:hypothetical protein
LDELVDDFRVGLQGHPVLVLALWFGLHGYAKYNERINLLREFRINRLQYLVSQKHGESPTNWIINP